MLRLYRVIIAEYPSLNQKIEIESPFAEVTSDGEGLRQVQLALTRKYIIIGQECFDKDATESLSNVYYDENVEPEFETIRLIRIMPLKAIRLKIYKRTNRKMLKIIVGNNKRNMYFEFGGHLLKRMYWIIWKDRVEKINISYNEYSSYWPYVDLFTEPETPLTSNSEYELPKKFDVYAELHGNYGKIENDGLKESKNPYINDEPSKPPILETIETIHRYFVDVLTNSKLRILDKKAAYSLLKSKSDNNYIVDLSNPKDPENYCTLNMKSVSTGLIRSKW